MAKLQSSGRPETTEAFGKTKTYRIASIDILRALTMVLMIFVNDLWTLKDAPGWMRHVRPGVDGIGLADVVYPAFIFIVGMSLFFAVNNRRKKGDSNWALLRHVISRTMALLVMGLFLVNSETINGETTGMSKAIWNVLCCLSFILIWNFYPTTLNKIWITTLRSVGILTLLVLAVIFRGGEDGRELFAIQWWGILGGIAWAYFASALILIYVGNNIYWLLAGWTFFSILSMAATAGLVPFIGVFAYIPNPIRGGTFVGLAMGGVLTSFICHNYRKTNDTTNLNIVLVVLSALLIALAIYTRTFWGLSKLGRTPAWLFLCSAFTILAFTGIHWLADVKRKSSWFTIVMPAGTDTLLCYLVPYFLYAFIKLAGSKLPVEALTSGYGLLKSLLFALLCVWITRILNRSGIRLKL